MKPVSLKIPENVVIALKMPKHLTRKILQEELAIHLYKEKFLSFGKARELSNLSKWEFADKLGEKRIERHYDDNDLENDILFANEEV